MGVSKFLFYQLFHLVEFKLCWQWLFKFLKKLNQLMRYHHLNLKFFMVNINLLFENCKTRIRSTSALWRITCAGWQPLNDYYSNSGYGVASKLCHMIGNWNTTYERTNLVSKCYLCTLSRPLLFYADELVLVLQNTLSP